MKTIGLLAGMSWQSSVEYYRIINEEINKRLGRFHSAKCLIYSFDFQKIQELSSVGDWKGLREILVKKASLLKTAGADFIVIGCNTMHLLAAEIEKESGLPLVHIASATANAITAQKLKKVGLLGTRFTMESRLYHDILESEYGISVIVPQKEDRQTVHDVIYNELTFGEIRETSRAKYVAVINKLKDEGAEGVILGCTEIPLLIKQKDVSIPVFDTTEIHSKAIAEYALEAIPRYEDLRQ